MKNSYLDYWKKSLGDEKSEDGRLYVYRHCKRNFGIEPYLKHVKKLKYRRALTAFRISAHNLEIETGRYVHVNKVGISRHDRFCTFCYEENKTKVMGDEVHAILNCAHFNDVRKRFMDKIYLIVPNFKKLNDKDRLIYMLTSENEIAVLISKFLTVILSAQRPSFFKLWSQINCPGDKVTTKRVP